MSRAIFLDRDGCLNKDEKGYTHKIEDFELFPDVIPALKLLKDFKLFIISNQSGIGRGYYKEEDFHKFNNHLVDELKKHNIIITETFFCPHTPEDNCDCRKPSTKFIEQAAKKYNLDLKKSFVIGDHPSDVEMAHKAGLKAVYVLTGHGEKHKENLKNYDHIAKNILDAAKWILTNS